MPAPRCQDRVESGGTRCGLFLAASHGRSSNTPEPWRRSCNCLPILETPHLKTWQSRQDGGLMRKLFVGICSVALTLWALVTPPAYAEVRIRASAGGQVGPFLDLFEKVRESGERVVIDGPCLSACTLVLSMV